MTVSTPTRTPLDVLTADHISDKPVDKDWSEIYADGIHRGEDGYTAYEAFDWEDLDGWTLVSVGQAPSAAYAPDGTRLPLGDDDALSDYECSTCEGVGELDQGPGLGTEPTDPVECTDCAGTGNTLRVDPEKLKEAAELSPDHWGAEGPMMNYGYPLHLFDEDLTAAAYKLRDLPLCIVHDDDGNDWLVLTGGGMDLSWEITEGYTRLGLLPPVHFDLPAMAGCGWDADREDHLDRYLLRARDRSLTVAKQRADRDLIWHRERFAIPASDWTAD